jgi:ribosomal protein S13
MDSILNLVVNAENMRMLVTLAFVCCAYVLMRSQMKEIGYSLNKRIDGVEASLSKKIGGLDHKIDMVELSLNKRIDDLKNNDFAHLNGTIEALTYALEKNGALQKEDKEYVDSRLAH